MGVIEILQQSFSYDVVFLQRFAIYFDIVERDTPVLKISVDAGRYTYK